MSRLIPMFFWLACLKLRGSSQEVKWYGTFRNRVNRYNFWLKKKSIINCFSKGMRFISIKNVLNLQCALEIRIAFLINLVNLPFYSPWLKPSFFLDFITKRSSFKSVKSVSMFLSYRERKREKTPISYRGQKEEKTWVIMSNIWKGYSLYWLIRAQLTCVNCNTMISHYLLCHLMAFLCRLAKRKCLFRMDLCAEGTDNLRKTWSVHAKLIYLSI